VWCACGLARVHERVATRVCGVRVLRVCCLTRVCGVRAVLARPLAVRKKICVVCGRMRGSFFHAITACMSISGGSACRIEDVSEGRNGAVRETSRSLEEESRLACALSLRGCLASVASLLPLRALPTPAEASHELTGPIQEAALVSSMGAGLVRSMLYGGMR
jgi:hypothetical protein